MVVSVAPPPTGPQPPLIHFSDLDDAYLAGFEDATWFHLLRMLRWRDFVDLAVQYYEALWDFNRDQAAAREERASARPNAETREEATVRLLFSRATMDVDVPPVRDVPPTTREPLHVRPDTIWPGQVPMRMAGRAPKCFFAMFSAFLVAPLLGRLPEPEDVRRELVNNPAFARACGFTLPSPDVPYRQSDIPSLRKLEQFDQIMTLNGLWDLAAVEQVRRNLADGTVQPEENIVHDTTHYHAHSEMTVVDVPSESEGGKPGRKSQSRTTKECRCSEPETCPHDWVLADEGAGTVVKAGKKKHWAHKASTLGLPDSGILLDAVAVSDAPTHDSRTLIPHLARLFERHPDLLPTISRVLDDSALDDAEIRDEVMTNFGIELVVDPNPRGRKPITNELPQGIDRITPGGTPFCIAGFPFDFLGCRHDSERFLFRAPNLPDGTPACSGCDLAPECLARGERRHIAIPFERLPWINPDNPHLSVRFRKLMAKRPAIERIQKLMKFDYGDDRLTKRGSAAFQARLDKTLLTMHAVLAYC
jgi:hypothetical protein